MLTAAPTSKSRGVCSFLVGLKVVWVRKCCLGWSFIEKVVNIPLFGENFILYDERFASKTVVDSEVGRTVVRYPPYRSIDVVSVRSQYHRNGKQYCYHSHTYHTPTIHNQTHKHTHTFKQTHSHKHIIHNNTSKNTVVRQ